MSSELLDNQKNNNHLYKNIIIPPPSIRDVINKTAQFLFENGTDLINEIRKADESGTKFPFLNKKHPYNEYFNKKLELLLANVDSEIVLELPKEINELRLLQHDKLQMINSISNDILFQKDYEKLDTSNISFDISKIDFNFATAENLISNYTKSIIHHTAKYCAIFGIRFMKLLAKKEKDNHIFNFHKPSNSLHSYFIHIIKCYKKCLYVDQDLYSWLVQLSSENSLRDCATKIKYIQEYNDQKAAEENVQLELANNKLLAETIYDWNNFVIVEEITFNPHDDYQVPVYNFESYSKQSSNILDILDTTDQAYNIQEDVNNYDAQLEPISNYDEFLIDEGEAVVIKSNYVRQSKRQQPETKYIKCPITGLYIQSHEFNKHLSIVLLSPKYKQQKDELTNRIMQFDAYCSDYDIHTNIMNMVEKNPEIFDPINAGISEPAYKKLKNN